MKEIEAPFARYVDGVNLKLLRIVGLDVDETVTRSAEKYVTYIETHFGIQPRWEAIRQVGLTKAYPELREEQTEEALAATWSDPDNFPELIDPHIPDIIKDLTDDGGVFQYIFVPLTSSKGDIGNIISYLRQNGIPFPDYMYKGNKAEKAQAWVNPHLEDSLEIGAACGKLGKVVLAITNDVNRERQQQELGGFSSVHITDWSHVAHLLRKDLTVLGQLGLTAELASVI